MTITITKRGQVPAAKPVDLTCRRCSTEFSCHLSDMQPSPDQRDSGVFSIMCPVCRAGVWLYSHRTSLQSMDP